MKIISIGFLIVVSLGAIFFLRQDNLETRLRAQSYDLSNPVGIDLATQALDQMSSRYNGEKTFKFFKDKFSQERPSLAHDLAHRLGSDLYRSQGIGVVLICDFTQNWGCFHSLIKEALAKEGPGVLKRAGTLCVQKSSQMGRCLDAIGHGLLYTFGYSLSGVAKALSQCDEMIRGELCYNGVFKEYNDRERIPFGLEITPPRQVPPELLEPCRSVDLKYQSSCYFEQPYWWNTALSKDFAAMGRMCLMVSGSVQKACFQGIGRAILAASEYNSDGLASEKCSQLPTQESEGECVLEEVSILSGTFGEQKYRSENNPYQVPAPTAALCLHLTDSQKLVCLEKIKEFNCQKLANCR